MAPRQTVASVKADEHDRRISALERATDAIAGGLNEAIGQLKIHVVDCDGRHKGVDDKIDGLKDDVGDLKAETAKQTQTLTQIQISLGTARGSKSTLIWIAQWVALPALAAGVALLGALFSGAWATHAGG